MPVPAQSKNTSNGDGEHRAELWTLYRTAFEDRNFQVNLNWDRTKHYFVFNVGVFSVAAAVHKLGEATAGGARWMVLGLFFLAALNSFFAAYSIWLGHTYYRKARGHLSKLQRQLGLVDGDLAMQTTRGMVRDLAGAPRTVRAWFTITNLAILLQLYIGACSAIAFVALLRR